VTRSRRDKAIQAGDDIVVVDVDDVDDVDDVGGSQNNDDSSIISVTNHKIPLHIPGPPSGLQFSLLNPDDGKTPDERILLTAGTAKPYWSPNFLSRMPVSNLGSSYTCAGRRGADRSPRTRCCKVQSARGVTVAEEDGGS